MDCACGKHHSCDIKHVQIGSGAISEMGKLAAAYQNILLVADENTFGGDGEQTEAALSGKSIRKVIFTGKTVLIPNEDAIAKVNENMAGIDLIVGIGSGVIQDLCKYVSFFSDYTVFVGGSSSFDMAPAPYNKRYALELFCEEYGLEHENIVYIGDDYGPGGNDESVYKSDFPYLTIDDYRTFPQVVAPLL